MKYLSIFASALLAVTAVAEEKVATSGQNTAQYYAPSNQYAPNYGYQPYYQPRPLTFPAPYLQTDPKYYKTIFSSLKQCVASKCDVMPKGYGEDINSALERAAEFTACTTSCVAGEFLSIVTYYKAVFGQLYENAASKLALTRGYLAGANDFDVLGNRTRVGDSCCLPNEFFLEWDQVLITAPVAENREHSLNDYKSLTISAQTYLDYCLNNAEQPIFGYLGLACDNNWALYLEELKKLLGYTILHPSLAGQVIPGSCNAQVRPLFNAKPNPKALQPSTDYCVAYKIEDNLDPSESSDYSSDDAGVYIKDILIKPVNGSGLCPETYYDHGEMRVTFKKVTAQAGKYFYVSGLPYYDSIAGECALNYNLTTSAFGGVARPKAIDVACLTNFESEQFGHEYSEGAPEFCNVRQYANYLQSELFNTEYCENTGYEENLMFAGFRQNLVCLYRIISLKCDCMQAVVNCYEHEHKFTSALGKTLGRAASILCGFVLCQKQNVYSLFGDQSGVDHTSIMRAILLEVGALSPSSSSLPLASIAFLSFGLGMVAFVVTKKIVSKTSTQAVKVEDGYQNLI